MLTWHATAEDAIISSFDPLKDCESLKDSDDLFEVICPGVFEYTILFSAVDLRWQILFDPPGHALQEGFNRSHLTDFVVDWRFNAQKPVAAITRYLFQDDGGTWQDGIYIISKIAGDTQCMIGFVAIADNQDALALARTHADTNVQKFQCGSDEPKWVGTRPADDPGYIRLSN